MVTNNAVKWVHLFDKMGKNPKHVEILQEITVGYSSVVYLISVNGQQYAVKMYNGRYNGTSICLTERNNILRVAKTIGDIVPCVQFYSKHTENEFHRDLLVMEKALGVPLISEVFNEQVFDELVNSLQRLHRIQLPTERTIDEIARIDACRETILQYVKRDSCVAPDRVVTHLDDLRNYYLEKEEIFNLPKTIVHGDLWWDNILVDDQRITIVDWLEMSEQDYCRELAQFKIGTLNEILDASESQRFFERMMDAYRAEFRDETVLERVRYYLPLMYLEESFYLPFQFFPWKIKYDEDAGNFRLRFLDYFRRSERFFQYGQDGPP